MPPKPSGDQPSSMTQGLGKVLSDLGGLMAAPDADHQWLQSMQMQIAQKIRSQTGRAFQGPGAQVPGMGGSPGQGVTGPGPLAGPPSPGMGVSPIPQAPNPDELRRMVGAGAGQ